MSITYSQIQKVLASDGQSSDFFGNNLAISTHGHMAFVGAPFDTIGFSNQGSVYFFLLSSDTWNFQQKLFLSDGLANDLFGSAIAISADSTTLIVGVPQFSTVAAGKVYVYSNSDNFWIQQTSLSVPTSDGWFGAAVGLSQDGNIVAIGAPRYGARSGIVHIFNRIVSGLGTSWVYQTQIPSPGSDHLFGSAISLSADGSTLLIGAVGRSKSYIFVNSDNTWIKQSSDLGNGVSDTFGSSVALSFVGDIALIGAPGHNSNQGAVYLYTRSDETWSSQYQLQLRDSDNLSSDAQLGAAVSLGLGTDGSATALVGAPGENTAYIFKSGKDEWTHFQKITASDNLSSVNFGNAVALSGNGLVAIVADSGLAGDRGSAYLFTSPAAVILANTSSLMPYLPNVLLATVLFYVGLAIMFLVVTAEGSE